MSALSIVGAGYVGLVTAACMAELGHVCVCVDADVTKVKLINAKQAPIHEPDLGDLLTHHGGKRLVATTDLREAVMGSNVTFVAVGTPPGPKGIDLHQVERVCEDLGRVLRDKHDYHVVVIKSTVIPGTTGNVVKPILERTSGKVVGVDFGLCMNPEFLTEGRAVEDFMKPDRLIIGGVDERSIEVIQQLYAPLQRVPTLCTNLATAEMIKYASNVLLATTISLANELANVCKASKEVDAADVFKGVHLSRYLATMPPAVPAQLAGLASFFWAGCGFGGSCLPKDTAALAAYARTLNEATPLLDAVITTNLQQPSRMVQALQTVFASLQGRRVTVLGLAFKEGTDDTRFSPAAPIVRQLVELGAKVTVHDPQVKAENVDWLPTTVQAAPNVQDAVADAEAVMVVTRWPDYQELAEHFKGRRDVPVVVDGRRLLRPQDFQRYVGIGRALSFQGELA
jgi:UDPglucose 6-dehydrogenase